MTGLLLIVANRLLCSLSGLIHSPSNPVGHYVDGYGKRQRESYEGRCVMAQFVMCSLAELKNTGDDHLYSDHENLIVNLDAIVAIEIAFAQSPWYEDDFPAIIFRIPSKDYADIEWLYPKGHNGTKQRNDDFAMVRKVGKLIQRVI